MKTSQFVVPFIALLVGLAAGYIMFSSPSVDSLGASAVGTTNSTQRISQIVANNNVSTTYVSGAVGAGVYTMASLSNGDANDRVITSIEFYFDTLGTISTSTAALRIQAATSSDSTTLNSNTNLVLDTSVATSTPVLFVASTTPGLTGTNANRIWRAGTNLNIVANGTTSGEMIVKVNYIAS